jgi:hypothetical protein
MIVLVPSAWSREMHRSVVCVLAVGLVLTMIALTSTSAQASLRVELVPSALNVAPGSTVDVSVDLFDSPGFTMTAISAVILYDPAVFTYVDPSVVQGGLLKDDWIGPSGWPIATAMSAGSLMQLRVGLIDWSGGFSGEVLTAGSGTLFTFTLQTNGNAILGPSWLTWGDADGGVTGLDYGDADFNDVVLPSSDVSISVGSVVPEPATIVVWGLLGVAAAGYGVWRRQR